MEDKTIRLLENYLDGDYRVSPMAPNKVTIEDIRKAEKALEVKFPNEYIAHLLAEGADVLGERGIYIEVKEDVWPRAKLYDVGPFWAFLYGLHTFTASAESEDWMRLETVGKQFVETTGIKAVPILQVIGDANVYCVNERGVIFRYNHEENILEDVNLSFWELFELELKELKERKERRSRQTGH